MAAAIALALYAPLLAAASVVVWRRPVAALFVFVVGLAVHNAAMAALYGAGVRGGALTAIQAWKEILLAVALARVGRNATRTRTLPFGPRLVDALALVFAGFVVAYVLVPQDVLGGAADAHARALALRHDLVPVGAFFLGRSLRLTRDDLRRLAWTVVGTASVVAVAGLVEEYTVSLDWLASHGVRGYFHDQLGFDYGGPRRLPENFVFNSGNEQELARRLVSTFLSPLGASYLFVVGLLAAAVLRGRTRLRLALAVVTFVGLLFTFSRASVAALAAGLLVVAALHRRAWPVVAAVAAVAAVVAVAPVFPDVAPRAHWTAAELRDQRDNAARHGGVGGTISGSEPSIHSHLTSLRDGLRTVAHQPQGYGLGNAGETASRTNTPIKAGESTYTELGVETGIAGALAFVAWMLALVVGVVRQRAAWTTASLVALLALALQTDVLGVPWLVYCVLALAAARLVPLPVEDLGEERASTLALWPRRPTRASASTPAS